MNSLRTYDFSSEKPNIDKYSSQLLIDNAQNLITYIYNHVDEEPYSNAETRVGLAIKILLKTNSCFDIIVLQPIIVDIENLMNDNEYLDTFENPEERVKNLTSELILVNKYKELSDTISLNK